MIDKNGFLNWLVYKKNLKESSLATERKHLAYFVKWIGRKRLTPNTCESFILYLRGKNRRNATINGYILLFIYIEQFLKIHLTTNIELFPKETRIPTVLTVDEIQAIIDAPTGKNICFAFPESRKVYLDSLMRVFVWFLAATGCRFDEAASLHKENLALGIYDGYATFKNTKTGVDRRVPIPPLLVEKLKLYIYEKKPSDFIFLSGLGHKLQEQTINPLLRRKVENANINKHVYCHCFRNSYIMEHIRQGTDVLTIAKLVGHADVNTTLGYTKFTYEDIERGAENHPLFSKTLTTEKILNKIHESVLKWPVHLDKRFKVEMVKKGNGLYIKLETK